MKLKLRSLSKSKFIICIIIFFIIAGISNDIYVNQTQFITFYEIVLTELDSTFSLLFAMTFILMLFSATDEKTKDTLSSKSALAYLKQAIAAALLILFLLLTASLAYSLISRGPAALANEWSYQSSLRISEDLNTNSGNI